MINTITLIQLYIDCCEQYKIKGVTPQGFVNTLFNELACTFLMDFALHSGYSEESLDTYINETFVEGGLDKFQQEVVVGWKQLTGEYYEVR